MFFESEIYYFVLYIKNVFIIGFHKLQFWRWCQWSLEIFKNNRFVKV